MTLFWMKLNTQNVFLGYHRGERITIMAISYYQAFIPTDYMIGVDEIETHIGLHFRQKRVESGFLDSVPTHVRDLQARI